MARYFIIDYSNVGVNGGRCSANTPMNAAKKFASKLFSDNKISKIMFCVRETTKESKKKKYYYNAVQNDNKIKVSCSKIKNRGGGQKEDLINNASKRGYLYDYDITLEEYILEYVISKTDMVPYIIENANSEMTLEDLKNLINSILIHIGNNIQVLDNYINFDYQNNSYTIYFNNITDDSSPLLADKGMPTINANMQSLCNNNCFKISISSSRTS